MKPFLDALRARTPARVWDRGVELARSGAVAGTSVIGDEVELRVKVPGRAVAPTVVLYLADNDWDCDCGERAMCTHIPAAAIALAHARDRGAALPAPASARQIRYRLGTEGDRLTIDRFLVGDGDTEQPLGRRLSAGGAEVMASSADLSIDRILGGKPRVAAMAAQIPELFATLSSLTDVWLGDRRIAVSSDAIAPRATIRDGARGSVELVIDRDPVIQEVVAAGVARIGDTLHPLAETALTGQRLEALPFVRAFAPGEIGTLVTSLLPELAAKLFVAIETDRLPGSSRTLSPRISLEVTQDGDELSVMPLLVYGDPPQARIDGDRLVHLRGDVPVRDRAAEKMLVFRLRDEMNLVPGHRVEATGRDAIALARRLAAWRSALTGRARSLFRDDPLVAHVEVDGDAIDVTFQTPDGSRAAPGAVIEAWRRGDPLAPLLGGGWAPLPAGFLDRHGHLVADLLAARNPSGKVAPFALGDLAQLCRELEFPPPPGLDRLRPLFESFTSLPVPPLPADLTAELRDYQKTGVAWLCFLRELGLGGVLADDMGLGKTLQALCAIHARQRAAGGRGTLVVCPTSVAHNWVAEVARFRPGLSTSLYHGPGRALDPRADITITTYALLRMDADELAGVEWDTAIMDEAQQIKNPDSQVARAAYRLRARYRLCLTGTPIENRLDELWSQLHFTNPGLLGGRSDFRDRIERPIADGDAAAAARLRARIRPFVLRRLKADVARELPPRTELTLHCELDDAERATYDAVRAAARDEVARAIAGSGGVMAVLEALLRLRQAACHRALLPGQDADRSSKLDLLLEVLDEAVAEGHKALVFSQWTSLLDLVEPALTSAGIAFCRLDGSTRDRAGVVGTFQSEDGPPVMLISLKAGGVGLNLTAADHVVLLDPWWNPAVEDQAADRAHRIGQDKPVLVYRLVARDTVEERVLALQARKRALAETALGEAGGAAAITRDELLALLD